MFSLSFATFVGLALLILSTFDFGIIIVISFNIASNVTSIANSITIVIINIVSTISIVRIIRIIIIVSIFNSFINLLKEDKKNHRQNDALQIVPLK